MFSISTRRLLSLPGAVLSIARSACR
jgi:hypothetical protein